MSKETKKEIAEWGEGNSEQEIEEMYESEYESVKRYCLQHCI